MIPTDHSTATKPRRVTRKEVAHLAGVSPTTVTHVLQGNPKTRVRKETRERILRVVKETRYVPHALASVLRRRSEKHLALVLSKPESADPFISPLLAACREEAQKSGYYLMTHEVGQRLSEDAGRQAFDLYQSGRADGLLIYKPDFLNTSIEFLVKHNAPAVVLESTQSVGLPGIVSVTTDHALGGRIAASHVLALGHRRIAVLTTTLESLPEDRRPYPASFHLTGIRETLAQWNVRPENMCIAEGDVHDRTKTLRALDELAAHQPTALLAGDDLLAVLALTYFQGRGVYVPKALSIVGYGGSQSAEFTEPALTTVGLPTQETGTLAVQLLLDRMKGRPSGQPLRLLKPLLLSRTSVANAPS